MIKTRKWKIESFPTDSSLPIRGRLSVVDEFCCTGSMLNRNENRVVFCMRVEA